MARYAIVDDDGLVVNVTEWDGTSSWEPPVGTTAIPDPSGQVAIGWTYANGVFTAPPPPVVVLGPTFGYELEAAGLGGLGLTWTSDGTINGRENLTTEQNATLDTVIAAHDPTKLPKNIILTSDWVARFTNQEYLAVCKQRATDIAANKVGYSKNWDIVATDDRVDLNKQKTQKIKTDLVAAGILTQARADEIFS